MAAKTTGKIITELGVRTVLAFNLLEDNHVDSDERQVHLDRIEKIVEGQAGVAHSKVMRRSLERCQVGAHAAGYPWHQSGLN